MIISKTPVRISIGGGGTDLPSFYKKHGSFFISAAVSKYIYIIIQERPFFNEYLLKYSKTETVTKISEIKNELIRESLKLLRIDSPLEIVTISDVGGQSGLGSSASFTIGLLNALHAHKREFVSQEQLAEEACHIAIDVLGLPSGKQDEYIAAYGGFRCFRINKKGKVSVSRPYDPDFLAELEHNLYLFSTGIYRESKDILELQNRATIDKDKKIIDNLIYTQKLGFKIDKALQEQNGELLGKYFHQHWLNKRKRQKTTNDQIDVWYNTARKYGAIGGKIIGAGGGGFFLLYIPGWATKLISKLESAGLKHVPFHFDNYGSKVIVDV